MFHILTIVSYRQTSGVVQNYNQVLIRFKSEHVTLIAENLSKWSSYSLCATLNVDLIGKCVGQPIRIFYKGFDDHITGKYGVVCRGWPLPDFKSPTDMVTKNEVELVLHSFKSGTTSFQCLSDTERRVWDEARFQASLEQMMEPREQLQDGESCGDGDHDAEMTMTNTTTSEPQPGPSSAPQGVLQPSQAFINGAAVDLASQKKKRKKCSDAGVPRGLHKKT